jgi:alkaline phosphatase
VKKTKGNNPMTRKTHHARKVILAALTAGITLSVGGFGTAMAANVTSAPTEHGAAQRIATIGNGQAKNVILFIGDGMGDSEITVARDYLHGAAGKFEGLDAIGQPGQLNDAEAGTGQYTTYSVGDGIADKGKASITPVTDSAASGSGWATGTKTYNNAIDVDANGNPQINLLELAKAAGKATGNVTTAEIQDATPAVLASHSTLRSCYGPQGKTDGSSDNSAKNCEASQLLQNGGIGSISEQLLQTRADVTLGGGNKYFKQTAQAGSYQGKTLEQQATERGYNYITDPTQLASVTEANQDKPLIGLFSSGNMPTQYLPSEATAQNSSKDESPTQCTTNPEWLGTSGASLSDMTDSAISLLSKNQNGSSNGYFLQVEGASIDKQDHNANACGQIGETDDLDQAIATALKKVDLSNTLIIVTADHAHTSQIVESQPAYALSTVLKSPVDGSKIVVAYGTATADAKNENGGYNGGSMSHTGTQLRIAASGPGAQRVSGLTDQTDNFFTIAKTLGLASSSQEIAALSNNANVTVSKDGDAVNAQITAFNGDASVSYSLKNSAGTTVAQSVSDSSVSGLRLNTTAATPIDLSTYLNEGESYTLTVKGLQSGVEKTISLQGPAKSASGYIPVTPSDTAQPQGKNTAGNKVISDVSTLGTKQLGRTGSTIVAVLLLMLAVGSTGGLILAWRKGTFSK